MKIETKSSYESAKHLSEALIHNNHDGGIVVGIFGAKGSGKTTLLIQITQKLSYINPITKKIAKEIVLWRGRDIDYWNWLDTNKVLLHFHDLDEPTFTNDLMIEIHKLPQILRYNSNADLMKHIDPTRLNVIYEPQHYALSAELKNIITKRGFLKEGVFERIGIDPVIFWFDFCNYLLLNKSFEFISIIFDEADDIFPEQPGGIRWHLQLWFKDVLRDFRKRNISLFFTAHSHQDIDFRIKSKIMTRIWMRGALPTAGSLVRRQAPLWLKPGQAFIERDGFGKFVFDKIDPKPRVMIKFRKIDPVEIGTAPVLEDVLDPHDIARDIKQIIASEHQTNFEDTDNITYVISKASHEIKPKNVIRPIEPEPEDIDPDYIAPISELSEHSNIPEELPFDLEEDNIDNLMDKYVESAK